MTKVAAGSQRVNFAWGLILMLYRLLIFFQTYLFFEKLFHEYHQFLNRFDQDQACASTKCVFYKMLQVRGAFGKFLAWSFISVTDLQTLSCLVSF